MGNRAKGSIVRHLMAQDRRKFVAKEIREERDKVYYEIWVDRALLCIVWISAQQRMTYGDAFLQEWYRRHEESLKSAGIAGVDLSNEVLKGNARAASGAG
jgi:hypothetical protein